MDRRTVLVTGGAGYVGSALVPKLVARGYPVKVIDWYIYGENVFDRTQNRKNLIQIKGDIRDASLLKKELRDVESIIHLACISNDPSYDLDPAFGKSVNYDATCLLVDL